MVDKAWGQRGGHPPANQASILDPELAGNSAEKARKCADFARRRICASVSVDACLSLVCAIRNGTCFE